MSFEQAGTVVSLRPRQVALASHLLAEQRQCNGITMHICKTRRTPCKMSSTSSHQLGSLSLLLRTQRLKDSTISAPGLVRHHMQATHLLRPLGESGFINRTAPRNARRHAQEGEFSPFLLPTDSNERDIVGTVCSDCGVSGKILWRGDFSTEERRLWRRQAT